jgi:hypothetical protein
MDNSAVRDSSYGPARAVAPAVHAHLAHHLEVARTRGESDLAQLPDIDTLEELIATAFWASLRREEGHPPKISIAFADIDETSHPLLFEDALSFEAGVLTKVALAVERPGIHLGVARRAGSLCVWGTIRTLRRRCCVIEVAEPGLIVVKEHRGDRLAKFVNIAVLQGDQVKIIDENATSLPDCPDLLTSLLGFDSPASWGDSVNVLVQLALSMRAHGRGGVLLVVPPDTVEWRESLVQPITYPVSPMWSELASLRHVAADQEHGARRDDLARAIDAVGGLTAVDGATVITTNYDVLAFGAKIARRRGGVPVQQVTVTEPIEGSRAALVNPAELGGTRHLSGAQFVLDQRDSVALVASQDGRFTIFAWSPCENSVHAHRVETLLL